MNLLRIYTVLKTIRVFGVISLAPAVFVVLDYFFDILLFPGYRQTALNVFILSCLISLLCAAASVSLILVINKRLKFSFKSLARNCGYSPTTFDSVIVEAIIIIYVLVFRYCKLVEDKIAEA